MTKRRKKRQRRLGRLLLVMVGIAAAGLVLDTAWERTCGGADQAGLCGWDRITRVEVVGAKRLNVDHVRSWAAVPPGASLWTLNGEEIIARLEERPWIRAVTVRKRFPSTVVLDIAERRPVAVAVTPRGSAWIDEDGHVVAPTRTDRGFPVVKSRSLSQQGPLETAADILAAFRVADVSVVAFESLVVDVSSPDDPIVDASDALRLRMGRGRFAEKWRRVEAIHENAAGRIAGPRLVDLRFEDRVVVSEWSGRS